MRTLPSWRRCSTERATSRAFTADYRNRDNGMIYQANAPNTPGAKQSAKLDFSVADAADTNASNAILWRDAKGDAPMPAPKHTVFGAAAECGPRRLMSPSAILSDTDQQCLQLCCSGAEVMH